MKKTYVTPSICIEHYELTQSIAACETKIGLYDSQCIQDSSAVPDTTKSLAKEMGWFLSGYCQNSSIGTIPNDGICYHTSANTAFSS